VEVRINNPSNELITLINRRFGKGAELKKEILVGCPFSFGGYIRKEVLNVTAWSDPGGATLNHMRYKGITKVCEPISISYIQFYSNRGLASLDNCIEEN
jgi:hypothetical protein